MFGIVSSFLECSIKSFLPRIVLHPIIDRARRTISAATSGGRARHSSPASVAASGKSVTRWQMTRRDSRLVQADMTTYRRSPAITAPFPSLRGFILPSASVLGPLTFQIPWNHPSSPARIKIGDGTGYRKHGGSATLQWRTMEPEDRHPRPLRTTWDPTKKNRSPSVINSNTGGLYTS